MRLVKLDAIGSTNDFLKEMAHSQNVDNFTVVTAETQTKGKGQMGAKWNSESGKNLIMSILIKDFIADPARLFDLNIIVSTAVVEALQSFDIPQLSIKWPNDILSGNKKIGGILIENSIKTDKSIVSVAGLGLNVNQKNFEDLPKASSLALISNKEFDKHSLLVAIVSNIEKNVESWHEKSTLLRESYLAGLFKKGVPMPFQNAHGEQFMGIISGVSQPGKLQLKDENGRVSEYGIKEIQMLY